MVNILFVCLGNICRSPTAHGVFEAKLEKRLEKPSLGDQPMKKAFNIDSAGTAAWHIGKEPDKRSQLAAKNRGYDLSHLRARQVAAEDFATYDYILAMDKANLSDLQSQCAREHQHKLALFLDYGEGPEQEVPDPYYGGDSGFDHVLDLIESASDGLLDQLLKRS